MKSLKPFLNKWLVAIGNSTRRFLVSNIMAFAFAITIIYQVADSSHDDNYLLRIQLIIFMMILSSAVIQLFLEKYRIPKFSVCLSKLLFNAIALIGMYILCFGNPIPIGDQIQFPYYYGGIFLILLIAFVVIQSLDSISRRFLELVGNFSVSLLLSIALAGGGTFILFSLDKLFSVYVSWKIYTYWNIICFVFVCPATFFGFYPKMDKPPYPMGNAFRFLLYYISIPILLIYTVIIYVYAAKILIQFQFPNNVMAPLVTWYIIMSFLTTFFSQGEKAQNDYEAWAQSAIRFLLPALSLPVILLFYAIYIRIKHYGFTELRYFMLLVTLFSAISFVLTYLLKQRAQKIIVMVLIALIPISSFSWLSAYDVSVRSQKNRVIKYAKKHNLLIESGGKQSLNLENATPEQIQELASLERYLSRKSQSMDILVNSDLDDHYNSSNSYLNNNKAQGVDYSNYYFEDLANSPRKFGEGLWVVSLNFYKYNEYNTEYSLYDKKEEFIKIAIKENHINLYLSDHGKSNLLIGSIDLIKMLGDLNPGQIGFKEYNYEFEYKQNGMPKKLEIAIIPAYVQLGMDKSKNTEVYSIDALAFVKIEE